MAVVDVLVRWRWRRRAVGLWLAAAVLAATTGVVVDRAVSAAADARDGWGATAAVWVATADLPAGHVLVSDDLVARAWPAGLRPPSALDAAGGGAAPVGSVLVAPVAAGEVLVAGRLAPAGLSPTAALVPADRRAVLVPAGSGLPPLAPGDRVDLTTAPGVLEPGAAARVVSHDAVVVAVGDDGATVAVRVDELPATAGALAAQSVVVALAGA
jgi:Flp pilus assembly protein CpaB